MPPGKGNKGKVFLFLQLIEYPADSCFRDAPAQGKVAAAGQRIAGAVAEIDHGTEFRALDLAVVVDGVYPEIQYNIHFRASAHTDQLMDSGNREKEKAHILQTWVVVVERRIVLFPAVDAEFDKAVPAQPCVGDVVLPLQVVQDGERLVLEARAEPFRQFRSPTDPLARPTR